MLPVIIPLLGLSSCLPEDPDDCCYNVRLEYRYRRAETPGGNVLGYYVDSLREYVFDAHDVLRAINDYRIPTGGGAFFSEQNLEPGLYTVVAFGNKGAYEQTGEEVVNITTRQDLRISTEGNSGRLYYGFRSFEVGRYGTSRIAVDMTHAHCVLGITARWVDDTGHPAAGKQYTLNLRQAPALYRFTPEFLVYNESDEAVFAPEKESYPLRDSRRINYIPAIDSVAYADLSVRGTTSGKTLHGEFITLRYRSDSHVLLSIRSAGEQVMKEIDLYRFFREMGIHLDYSLRQEDQLSITINGDRVSVGMVSVNDWDEGGVL
ncbi:MAG: FimB/Mfa2 family fimbrial subunit [Dysgonamonadaceae bacterium]|jgi:hypothetical protein|nr:FimB/Mfa2 family fimbrial subunit [Dysgonamonadaceae bacterium]